MKIIIITILVQLVLFAQNLSFGAISTVNKKIMEKKLKPIMSYISKTISNDLEFKTGFDYADTIEKFKNGTYDLGFIGPAPFVIAMQNTKKPLKIIVGLNNKSNGNFHSVIIVKKNSVINSLKDLKNRSFAFGSPQSTLSYFMPMNLLQNSNMVDKLSKIVFLGKHDMVAKYVIMGKYDAGGIKTSIAKKYSKYLKIIDKTPEVPDFLIVASANTPDKMVKKIRDALLLPQAQKLAKSIKSSAIGFKERKVSDYDQLKSIMMKVNSSSSDK